MPSSHVGGPSTAASGAATPHSEDITPATVLRTPFVLNPAAFARSSQTTGFSASSAGNNPRNTYFHSRRVKKDSIEKPWLAKTDPKERWITIIPCFGVLVGLAISAVLVWEGMSQVVNHTYCPVMMEDWSRGIDSNVWLHEVEVGGFGNGQFEHTTSETENSFIGGDGALHIRPTLQDETLLTTNNILNLTKLGICTSDVPTNCAAATNTTNGTMIPPIRSARLKSRATITYGRIEVKAKLPRGKWLWPAIWMLPETDTYGDWPASGEIDIMESRGNDPSYSLGGNNIISSTLHWGPDSANNAWWRTNSKHRALHTTFADKFHTFGIEWSENYIYTYVNSRLLQVLYTNFEKPLWERGNFPLANENGTRYIDPWAQTGRRNTPFDRPFQLIMNVAVGGTNGWFKNGEDGKPWVDGSRTERRDFYEARDDWLPTWGEEGRDMVVESVKMWQQC